ncbi:ROK family transcriptional regulator [Streptomyces bauhiniae]|uniref:ROK family transcriptional regulator n=1 Tax=Streptomyces bauhiniae TaxID=2340725 RepID=UPI00332B28CB
MTPAKPSLEMLRALTDENVLRALMADRRLTRAEIAARTGISKPTISDAVQRLAASGLLVDTGERTTGRGRSGSYYALAPGLGTALVASISPRGVTAETVDALGDTVGRAHADLGRDAGEHQAARALAEAAARLTGPSRLAVVSAADPVDRATGRLVRLPDAPFLVGALDPAAVLAPHVTGPVLVDNDVNWAARAEHAAVGVDDFVYLHLGEGLGCAVVTDGTVRRGHGGLAGEIAHVYTPGPDGTALPFTEVFATLGLRRPNSTAIDVPALEAAITSDTGTTDTLARAVGGVLTAAVALTDPALIVLGGEWGRLPLMRAAIERHLAAGPRPVSVVTATVDSPELTAARERAVAELRELVVGAER